MALFWCNSSNKHFGASSWIEWFLSDLYFQVSPSSLPYLLSHLQGPGLGSQVSPASFVNLQASRPPGSAMHRILITFTIQEDSQLKHVLQNSLYVQGCWQLPSVLVNQFITQEMKHLAVFQTNRLIFYSLKMLLGTWLSFSEGLLIIGSFLSDIQRWKRWILMA